MAKSECEGASISRGARHGVVRELQAALNQQDLRLKLSVDGDFGPRTEAAVIQFQLREPSLTYAIGGVVTSKELELLKVWKSINGVLGPTHIGDKNWKVGLYSERINLGSMAFDRQLGRLMPTVGSGHVIRGYEKLKGGRLNTVKGVWTFHPPEDPDRAGIRNNECARLVQGISNAVGLTRTWRRGPHLRKLAASGTAVPRGTVVATLGDGYYNNDHSGRSHVGLFDGWIKEGGKITGFYLFDQYNGADISIRGKKFYGDGKYDRDKLYKRETPGAYGDYTVAVYDDTGAFLGITVIEDPVFKLVRHKVVSIGDEYYVVYTDGRNAVEIIP